MLGREPAQAAATALLFTAGLACGRTSLEARLAADAGTPAPSPSPDAGAVRPPDAKAEPDAAPETSNWTARCRENLASAGVGVNGNVSSLAIDDDDTVYLGGDFTRAGPLAGGGVPFALPEGLPAPSFARVSGSVFAVAPDGAGGWFIGGWFDHVGSLPRQNLAHIRAGGDVDAGFQADADDKVSAIAVIGNRVYVGGQFTTLAGTPRSRLGMVDFTGSLGSWEPGVAPTSGGSSYPNAAVRALLAIDGKLYVGGDFSQIAGAARANLALFEADGSLAKWSPPVNRLYDGGQASVRAIASDGNTLWIGGNFDEVSGVPHRAIAAFDLSGNLRSWDPRFEDYDVVAALAAGPNVLYVGGKINSLGPAGHRQSLSGLAAFDGTGAPLDWHPSVITETSFDEDTVAALALAGDTLFVGGDFSSVAGVPRVGLAALDRSARVLDWDPSADGPVYALATQGNTIYAGGAVTTLCGQERNSLAAIAADGRLLDWNPDVRGYVQKVVRREGSLLFGGGFITVGGQERELLAEVSLSDGRPTALAPKFDNGGWVSSIQPLGGAIYIGGGFTAVNGKPVSNIAALAADGSLLPWSLRYGWTTSGPFAALGDVLYVAGRNDAVASWEKLVALTANATLESWSVDANRGIWVLFADETHARLYVGGSFSEIAGARRPGLAAFDPTGKLLPWNATLGITPWWVDAIATFGEDLLVGGVFKPAENQLDSFLLALDSAGKQTPWNPSPNAGVSCLKVHKGTVYVAGGFSFIDGRYVGGFAKLER